MKTIRFFLASILLGLTTSCGLIDVDTISTISGDGYWQSKGDVDSYLVGIYTSLRDACNQTRQTCGPRTSLHRTARDGTATIQ